MRRTVFVGVLVGVVLAAHPASAIDKCRVKIDGKTGVISVSAVGASGPVLWGETAEGATKAFFNAGTCLVGASASGCQLADPATVEAKTPPPGCTIYLQDEAAPCSAWIVGCTPGVRAVRESVCGDGRAEGAEVCDGADVDGKTCASEVSAPYGKLACNKTCDGFDASDCGDRLRDNGDGTFTDRRTGLMWEKKTTAVGSGENYADPHDVDNVYTWSSTGVEPDGSAFTEFLPALNAGSGFAGYTDWRLPDLDEIWSFWSLASSRPEISEPYSSGYHWSLTTYRDEPSSAWSVPFNAGSTTPYNFKTTGCYIAAVRSRF